MQATADQSYRGLMRRPKTPQEKKRLSLEKDRRNAYGENDKASRKAIPLAKAKVNRANRRGDAVSLTGAIGEPDTTIEAEVEDAVEGRRRKAWRKWPDQRLGKVLDRKRGDLDTDDEQRRRRVR